VSYERFLSSSGLNAYDFSGDWNGIPHKDVGASWPQAVYEDEGNLAASPVVRCLESMPSRVTGLPHGASPCSHGQGELGRFLAVSSLPQKFVRIQ